MEDVRRNNGLRIPRSGVECETDRNRKKGDPDKYVRRIDFSCRSRGGHFSISQFVVAEKRANGPNESGGANDESADGGTSFQECSSPQRNSGGRIHGDDGFHLGSPEPQLLRLPCRRGRQRPRKVCC